MPRASDGSIRVSTADENTLEQAGIGQVGVAVAPAGSEPDEYPIDIEEWQAGVPAYYRTLVAGYRNEVRIAGELTAKKMRAVWDRNFKLFCGEITADDAK